MHTLRRTITPEVRVIDAAAGIVDYIASDQTLDSYREIILSAGWRFTHFKKNAPFVDSHNYYSIDSLLGSVISYHVDRAKSALIERVQWAVDVAENKLAQLGFRMTESGHLKGVSVGFWPVKSVRAGGEGWTTALDAAGIDPKDAGDIFRIFTEQEQVELSAVILGANPNALAKAYDDGIATDEDFETVLGFDGDLFDFMRACSDALEQLPSDNLMRAMIALDWRRALKANSRKSFPVPGLETASLAGSRRGAGDARRGAPSTAQDQGENTKERDHRERQDFLKRLAGITAH